MNFNIPINIKKIDFDVMTIVLGIYLVIIGIAYYCIFHKHHKRNKIELDELVSLVSKFYTLTIFSCMTIIMGIACIIQANEFKDSRADVIFGVLLGIGIISITIINYFFYIKRKLEDPEELVRNSERKATLKIGEVIALIFFIIFIAMPIWRIPVFITLIENKKELMLELARSFGLCIASLLLLNSINPIDIKGKIKKIFTKKEKKIK